MLYNKEGQNDEAESLLREVVTSAQAELSKAVTLEPDNINYLYALTEYYLKRGKFQEAKPIAQQMVASHPAMQVGHNLLSIINRKLKETN